MSFPWWASTISLQSGCQSPGQPTAALKLPGTETSAPPGPGPGSTGSTPSTGTPTEANVDAAARSPAASLVTARYSTSAPRGRSMSWKTRGTVVSAVPSAVHDSSPTTRKAKEVSAHASAMLAATGTEPASAAPGAGANSSIAGPPATGATGASATRTTAPSGGTVSSTMPSSSAVTVSCPPYRLEKLAPGLSVVTST